MSKDPLTPNNIDNMHTKNAQNDSKIEDIACLV
jgi:hypothetical protein